jgi:hypothetical protein
LNPTFHTGCDKSENSAKRNNKGAVYGDREAKQFAKLLTSSGVAVV